MPDPYISEVKYRGNRTEDFVEVAVDAGTDVSNLIVTIYNSNGTINSTNLLSGLSPVATIFGKDVYVIQSGSPSSFNKINQADAVALSESGTVYQFISFDNTAATVTASAGAANGLTSTDVGQAGYNRSLETTDGGATYYVQSPNSGTIPCLTKGTRVQTSNGQVKVEDLEPGMRLLTVDGGYAPLRMILRKAIPRAEFLKNENLAPVRIKAGALGLGLPKADLLVSRQHRMLVSSPIVKRMFGETDVLIAAIRLTELPGVYVDTSVADVEYFHLLMDQHRVIFAEGAPTESLFLGEHILSALPSETIGEIRLLFPEIAQLEHGPEPACLIPNGKMQKQLLARHVKNNKGPLTLFQPPLEMHTALAA
ncbi:Hint domain-containing protein [Nioella sp.]|uniref:Hint domain-containing protein n=1 Tax=Nioella sp. TaxID=1912091 RepID=UPI0035129D15